MIEDKNFKLLNDLNMEKRIWNRRNEGNGNKTRETKYPKTNSSYN